MAPSHGFPKAGGQRGASGAVVGTTCTKSARRRAGRCLRASTSKRCHTRTNRQTNRMVLALVAALVLALALALALALGMVMVIVTVTVARRRNQSGRRMCGTPTPSFHTFRQAMRKRRQHPRQHQQHQQRRVRTRTSPARTRSQLRSRARHLLSPQANPPRTHPPPPTPTRQVRRALPRCPPQHV